MTGQDALDAVAAKSFDIVFLDYQMPGMTGDKVARKSEASLLKADHLHHRLRAQSQAPDIDLVMRNLFPSRLSVMP